MLIKFTDSAIRFEFDTSMIQKNHKDVPVGKRYLDLRDVHAGVQINLNYMKRPVLRDVKSVTISGLAVDVFKMAFMPAYLNGKHSIKTTCDSRQFADVIVEHEGNEIFEGDRTDKVHFSKIRILSRINDQQLAILFLDIGDDTVFAFVLNKNTTVNTGFDILQVPAL